MLKLQELYNLKAFDSDVTVNMFLVDPFQMTKSSYIYVRLAQFKGQPGQLKSIDCNSLQCVNIYSIQNFANFRKIVAQYIFILYSCNFDILTIHQT